MNIEKTIQEDRQAKLTVEYTTQEFEVFKRRAAKQISKDTKIPGFRPGKAPYNVILNRYGEGAILQEAIDILLDDDYSKMLDQAEIEPSGSGNLESIESYDPPKLVFLVPLEPEINLGDYREIRKEYNLEEFDLSKVDDFITNLQRNAATIIPADHAAEEGNLVYFSLSGEFLNPAEDDDAVITEKTPQQVLIPAADALSENEWPFSGFARELLGVKAGETKEIQHTYAEDYRDEDFQNKTAVFSADIQSVKELELPEIDETFVQTMGDYETPEAFHESIEAHLRADHQEKYDETYFDELLNEIIDQTEMTYPPQMLAHEEEHVLEDIKDRLKDQNLDYETYLKLREMDEETFLEEEIRPNAEKRLKRSLVVDELIKAEDLKLKQETIRDEISRVMTEVFSSGNAPQMQEEMGQEAFSQAITMEAVQRAMNNLLQTRMKLVATGQPIPVEEEEEATAPDLVSEQEVDTAKDLVKEEIIDLPEETPVVEAEDVNEESETFEEVSPEIGLVDLDVVDTIEEENEIKPSQTSEEEDESKDS